MSNVIHAHFPASAKEANEMADEVYVVLNSYSNRVTLATMVGVLEMIKTDVLDSMKGKQ